MLIKLVPGPYGHVRDFVAMPLPPSWAP